MSSRGTSASHHTVTVPITVHVLYLWASASHYSLPTRKVSTSDLFYVLRYRLTKALLSNHRIICLISQNLSCAEKNILPFSQDRRNVTWPCALGQNRAGLMALSQSTALFQLRIRVNLPPFPSIPAPLLPFPSLSSPFLPSPPLPAAKRPL